MPSRADDKALNYVLDLFEGASRNSDMSRVRDEWNTSDRLVEGWLADKNPNRANFFIPRTFSTLRAELSTIAMSMFSQDDDPPFVFRAPDTLPSGIPSDDVILQADLDTAFIANQMRALQAFLIFRNWFDDALRYGTAVLKVGWRRVTGTEFEDVPVTDPVTGMPIMGMDGQPLTRPEPQQVIHTNRPTLGNVDIRNFFVDPNFDTIDDMDFVIHRKQVTRQYLEDMAAGGVYRNVRTVLDAKTEASSIEVEEFSQILRSSRGMSGKEPVTVDKEDPAFKKHAKVTILECQRADEFITVATSPGKALLRKVKNPFQHGKKTFIEIHNIRRPKLFFGKSEPMLIQSLQEEENFITNTACDTMTMALHKMFVADRNADIDLDRLKNKQGNIILSNDVDAVKQLDVSEAGITAYQILSSALSGAVEDATSVTRTFKGATPIRGETATTTASLLGQASQAIKFKWKEWFHEGVVPFAKMLQSMNRQFITEEQMIRINNHLGQEQFVNYTASRVDVDFPVYPAASLEDVFGNKELRQANILRFLQVAMGNPAFAQYIKPYGMLLETAKALDFRNLKQLLLTPEEMAEAQQYQQAFGQPPPGTTDLRLIQGGQQGQGNFGEGQRPQNAPQPESAEDLVRATSTRGTQGPA